MTTVETVETKPTLFLPATIGLRSSNRGDYKHRVAVGSRLEWEPMAGCLDWSTVADLKEFYVRARLVEYVETRQKSDNAKYDGRCDFRRVPNGRGFGRTICKVRVGDGDHTVRIRNANGKVSERVIPACDVMGVVRLFVSMQYIRRGLDMQIEEFEQLGAHIVKDSASMIIRPVGG